MKSGNVRKNACGWRNYSIEIKLVSFDHTTWVITQAAILTRYATLGKLIRMVKSREMFISKNGKITNSESFDKGK